LIKQFVTLISAAAGFFGIIAGFDLFYKYFVSEDGNSSLIWAFSMATILLSFFLLVCFCTVKSNICKDELERVIKVKNKLETELLSKKRQSSKTR
jgi:Na+/melibiose symporter-like transporter